MNNPRKHHYIPSAYLAGFTEPASNQLHVFDRREGKAFRAAPENVDHKRDFYRVEKNPVVEDEFVVERQFFQRVDDDGLAALRRFADDTRGADRQTREMAMAYMAAAYLRTPKVRESVGRLNDRMLKAWIAEMFQDEEEFQRFLARIPEERRNEPDFDPEQLREFGLDPDNYTISLDKNWTVGTQLEAIVPIAMRGLSPRGWVVMHATESEHFITGDVPLLLVPTGPVDGPIVRLDSPDTVAIFPVDRSRALIGLGKGAAERRVGPRGVPAVNRATALHSHRHVFACDADFAWEDETGAIIGSEEFLALGPPGPDPAAEHYPIPPRPC